MDKNITAVTYEQFELLLKYAVAVITANEGEDFALGAQYFIDTSESKLRIYNGAGTTLYDSSGAITSLAYIKTVEWDGTNYAHKFTKHKADNTEETYSIEKVDKIDSDATTTYLPYIRIGANVYKIPSITLNNATNNSPSFYAPTSGGTSGQYLKSNGNAAPSWVTLTITLNNAATTTPSFYAPTGVGTSGQFLKSSGSGAPVWDDLPVQDVQVSTNGSTYTTIVDSSHIAKLDLSSYLTSSAISDMATQTWVGNQGYLTSVSWTDIGSRPSKLSDFTNDIIEGNPTGTTTENLTAIKIGNTLYGIASGGTTVVANPSGTATGALTSIQIGTDIYSVTGGGGSGMTNPMTTAGDMIVGGTDGAAGRLGAGSNGQVLSIVSGVPSWVTFDPTTTAGDIIVRGSTGLSRLGIGTEGQVLTVSSGAVTWQTPSGGGGEPSAYIKTITKSGRTLTWTDKSGTADSLDTSYAAATQSADGLMSSTDKTKLDGLVSNKVDTLYSGSPIDANSHTQANLAKTKVSEYHTIMVVGHDQWADANTPVCHVFNPAAMDSGDVNIWQQLPNWGDQPYTAFFWNGGYLRAVNKLNGTDRIFYITRVIGFKS